MRHLVNSVRLMGNTGMDPEVKTVGNGLKLVRLSLATTEGSKNAKGEWVNNTQWHNLVLFGNTAEYAEKYISKGQKIVLEGRLNQKSYVDKEGQKRYATEIVVNELALAGGKIKVDRDELPF